MPVFTWRRDSKDRREPPSAEELRRSGSLNAPGTQPWSTGGAPAQQQLKQSPGGSSSRPGTSRLASGSTGAQAGGFLSAGGGAALYRPASSHAASPTRSGSLQHHRSQSPAAIGYDAGRPSTAAGSSMARQHASAVAAYLSRPMSSGSLGTSTQQHELHQQHQLLSTRLSSGAAGHGHAAGAVYLTSSSRPGSSGGPRPGSLGAASGSGRQAGGVGSRYSGEFFSSGSSPSAARTPSVDTLLANVQLGAGASPHHHHGDAPPPHAHAYHPQQAWQDGGGGGGSAGGAQPASPSAGVSARLLAGLGEAGAQHPTGLPPPSPSRLSSSLKLMPRSSSARQEQHSSLLATLMVQQVGGGDPGSPMARGIMYSPPASAVGGMRGARKASGKAGGAHGRGVLGGGGGSAASSPKASYSARPGTSHAGAARSGGSQLHGPAAAVAAAAAADHLLQRRFSTGSVAGNQQWAEHVAEQQQQQQQQQAARLAAAAGHGVAAVGSRGGGGPLAEGWGTLTCVRPSTAHGSNFALAFAAESQQEFSSAQPPGGGDPGVGMAVPPIQAPAAHHHLQQQHNQAEEPVSPAGAAWAAQRPASSSSSSPAPPHADAAWHGRPPQDWPHATHFVAHPPGRPPPGAGAAGVGPTSPTKSSRTLVAPPAQQGSGSAAAAAHAAAGTASSSVQQVASHNSAASSSKGSHAEPTQPGEWGGSGRQQHHHATGGHYAPQAREHAAQQQPAHAGQADHHQHQHQQQHHLAASSAGQGSGSEAMASAAFDAVPAQSSSVDEPSAHAVADARQRSASTSAAAATSSAAKQSRGQQQQQPPAAQSGAGGGLAQGPAAPQPAATSSSQGAGYSRVAATGQAGSTAEHLAPGAGAAAAPAAAQDGGRTHHLHPTAWGEQADSQQRPSTPASSQRPGNAATPQPYAQAPRAAAPPASAFASAAKAEAAASPSSTPQQQQQQQLRPPPPPPAELPQPPRPSTATHYAKAAAASGGSQQQQQHHDGRPDSAAPGGKEGESSTNPLHMFVSLASKRVPVYPPRLPHAVDEGTLLSGHISTEHTTALPGYAVGKVIGEGGFCQVRLGVHRLSGRRVAIKVIDKAKLADAGEARRIQREIRVMRHLNHECVVKLFEVVDAPTLLYLVMEHAPCGSLLDYVRSRKRLSEENAVLVLKQIVAGLVYCHQREVVHRDIKLENILLDANSCMKLIDFGLSAFFIPGKQLRVHCGSPSYAAPEIVSRKHYDGPPVDVWSLGVVLFAMLVGHLPFHSSSGNKQELCAKIIEGKYNCPDFVSAPAKDLLSKMLCVEPSKRIRLDQITQHAWLAQGAAWQPIGASVYMVRCDLSAGFVYADEQLVMELEAAGYQRQTILQHLLAGDANYITAAYFLMAEGKVEVIKRMRGAQAAHRYIARAAPPSSGSQPASGAAAAADHHSAAAGAGGPLTSAAVAAVAGGAGGAISTVAGAGGTGSGKLVAGGAVAAAKA